MMSSIQKEVSSAFRPLINNHRTNCCSEKSFLSSVFFSSISINLHVQNLKIFNYKCVLNKSHRLNFNFWSMQIVNHLLCAWIACVQYAKRKQISFAFSYANIVNEWNYEDDFVNGCDEWRVEVGWGLMKCVRCCWPCYFGIDPFVCEHAWLAAGL